MRFIEAMEVLFWRVLGAAPQVGGKRFYRITNQPQIESCQKSPRTLFPHYIRGLLPRKGIWGEFLYDGFTIVCDISSWTSLSCEPLLLEVTLPRLRNKNPTRATFMKKSLGRIEKLHVSPKMMEQADGTLKKEIFETFSFLKGEEMWNELGWWRFFSDVP